MIKEKNILKRDGQNTILCPKHNIIANNICIKENCENIINCIECDLIENHDHKKINNISISNLLNINIENQIYDGKMVKIDNIQNLENIFKNIKKEIFEDFENLEKFVIDFFKENDTSFKILKKKKKFQNMRIDFFEDDKNLEKLKNLAVNFLDFTKTKLFSKKKDFLNFIKDKLTKFKEKMKNNTKDFKEEIKNFNVNFFENSDLINSENINFINNELFNNKIKNVNLLYKASKDGFTKEIAKKKIINKGPLFVIIKSEENKIFGGYYNDQLKNCDKWIYVKDSFIFFLDEKIKFLQKENDKKSFYGPNSIWICAFGQNPQNDIFISSNCNQSEKSFCNFGSSFVIPEKIEYKNPENKKYFGKNNYFKVIEIEIFEIINE